MQYTTTLPLHNPLTGNQSLEFPRYLIADDAPLLVLAVAKAVGLMNSEDQRIEAWIPAIAKSAQARFTAKPATANKATEEITRLLRYLSRVAITWDAVTVEMIMNWCSSARPDSKGRHREVAANTASNRAWAARAGLDLASMLGADVDLMLAHSIDLKREASENAMRPLTESETQRVIAHARGGITTTSVPLIVALAFAGASSEETAVVTPDHIDAERGFVRLPGTDSLAARINPLCDWGHKEIAFQLRNRSDLNAADPMCVTPGLPLKQAKHSVTVRLRRVLGAADLSCRPGVVPRSLRYTTAHRIAHAHGIITAALFLGTDAVDDTISVFMRAQPEDDGHG